MDKGAAALGFMAAFVLGLFTLETLLADPRWIMLPGFLLAAGVIYLCLKD